VAAVAGHDSGGQFIRQGIPELAGLSDNLIQVMYTLLRKILNPPI